MKNEYFLLLIVYIGFFPAVSYINNVALLIYTAVAAYVAIDIYRSNNKYKAKKQ